MDKNQKLSFIFNVMQESNPTRDFILKFMIKIGLE